ncbi:MAG TPA: CHRD domain-containing protein [Caulobacteraceae bacterium]|nr:CHRD domain-containing protein [Caulobacteraceae bacterium]
MRLGLAIAGAAILTFAAGAAFAAEQQYDGRLTGAAGAGHVHLDFDTDSGELDYTATFQGVSAPVSAGFHGPSKSGDAPVLISAPVTASPISGVVKLTDVQARQLNVGLWSFQIDTAAQPAALRGQISRSQ